MKHVKGQGLLGLVALAAGAAVVGAIAQPALADDATTTYTLYPTPQVMTWPAGRSRTGRYVMPAWQKRQPRAHPRRTSSESRSWTMPM